MSGRKIIPARLRRFRKEGVRLQVQELAVALGVTPSAVSSWECGKTLMSGPVCKLFEAVIVEGGFEVEATWAWLAGEDEELRGYPPIIVHM